MTTPSESPPTRLNLDGYSTEAPVGAVKVLRRLADNIDITSYRDRERHQMLGVLAAYVAKADPVHGVLHQDPAPLDELDGTQLDGLGRLIWHAANRVATYPTIRDTADVLWAVADAVLDVADRWRAEEHELQDDLFGVGEFIPEDRLIAPCRNDRGETVAGYVDINGNQFIGDVVEVWSDH